MVTVFWLFVQPASKKEDIFLSLRLKKKPLLSQKPVNSLGSLSTQSLKLNFFFFQYL